MKFITGFTHGHETTVSTLRLWLVFFAFAGVAALLITALQRLDDLSRPTLPSAPTTASAPHDRPPMPHAALAPTFAAAAESLRTGRHAEAYGRFVTLAEEGDADAGRIALVMHRFGPAIFGSSWDASVEQIEEWTQWSEAAAQKELAQLRAAAHRTGTERQLAPCAAVARSR